MKISSKHLAYITLIVYWLPFSMLNYSWGIILLSFIIVFKPGGIKINKLISQKIYILSFLFLGIFTLSFGLNYFIVHPSFNNFIWSLITYGSSFSLIFALLLLNFNEKDMKDIFYFSLYITIFQIALGYFQMLSKSSFQSINPFVFRESIGDAFTGTLFGSGLGAFAAIKVSLTFMLYFPFLIAKWNFKVIFIFLILLIGWILPSAIFSLICGFTAIFLYFGFDHFKKYILRSKIKPSFIYMLIVSILAFSFFAYLQPRNKVLLFSNIKHIYSTIKEQDTDFKTRKITYYKNTLFKLPKEFPVMLLIGVGPGNYSSRSAWIVSGVYLLNQHKYIKVTPSKIASDYNIKLWNRDLITESFKGAGSIVHQPFSTWFSIFAETGIIGVLIFFLLMKYFYRAFILARKLYKDPFMNSIASGLLISLIYIVILFIIENLFEYPQVMGQFFVFSCVLIKIIESKVKNARLNNSYHAKF